MDRIEVKVVQRPAVNPTKFLADSTRLTFKENFVNVGRDSEPSEMDKEIVKNLTIADHSPLGHCNYSVLIKGASRSFLAQIRTHRLASFTSASQHYINQVGMDFVIPIEVYQKCEELNSVEPMKYFLESYERSFKDYQDAQKMFGLNHAVTRQMTPQGARNNLLITANVRQWLKFIALRECGRNTSETLYVMFKIREALMEECLDVFKLAGPACYTKGKCSEGKLCCGQPWKNGKNPQEEDFKNLQNIGNKWRGEHDKQI